MPRRFQTPHQIFGSLDELGLVAGLARDSREDNLSFKKRLSDYWKNTPGSTYQGMVNAISTELGMDPYNTIDKTFFWLENIPVTASGVSVYVDGVETTPQLVAYDVLPSGWPQLGITETVDTATSGWILWQDNIGDYTQLLQFVQPPSGSWVTVEYSFEQGDNTYTILEGDQDLDRIDPIYGLEGHWKCYAKETPDASSQVQINFLNDSDYLFDSANGLVDSNGVPTRALETIVKVIQDASPISWGKFIWDEAYYQDRPDTIETLPSMFDAGISGFVEDGTRPDFQSGIGVGKDLLVIDVVESTGYFSDLHPTGYIF